MSKNNDCEHRHFHLEAIQKKIIYNTYINTTFIFKS